MDSISISGREWESDRERWLEFQILRNRFTSLTFTLTDLVKGQGGSELLFTEPWEMAVSDRFPASEPPFPQQKETINLSSGTRCIASGKTSVRQDHFTHPSQIQSPCWWTQHQTPILRFNGESESKSVKSVWVNIVALLMSVDPN